MRVLRRFFNQLIPEADPVNDPPPEADAVNDPPPEAEADPVNDPPSQAAVSWREEGRLVYVSSEHEGVRVVKPSHGDNEALYQLDN